MNRIFPPKRKKKIQKKKKKNPKCTNSLIFVGQSHESTVKIERIAHIWLCGINLLRVALFKMCALDMLASCKNVSNIFGNNLFRSLLVFFFFLFPSFYHSLSLCLSFNTFHVFVCFFGQSFVSCIFIFSFDTFVNFQ